MIIIINPEDLNVDNLYNGKVSVYNGKSINGKPAGYNEPSFSGFASEGTLPDNKSKVTINTNALSELNTVSNIQNLMIHEFKGHGYPLNYSDENKTHHKAYEFQFRHKSWKSTTQPFKDHMISNYNYYLSREKK